MKGENDMSTKIDHDPNRNQAKYFDDHLKIAMKGQSRKGKRALQVFFSSKPFRTCGAILHILGLILAFFFIIRLWPETAAAFSPVIIALAIGMILISGIRRNYAMYKQGKYPKRGFLMKTGIEMVEITLTAFAAIFLAGASARYIAQTVGEAVEIRMPGLGLSVGLLSGISAAVLVGLCVGYVARIIFRPIGRFIVTAQ
jgi:hypothetical protein